ncbi:hypothetical protein VE03_10748 [Pseudogymnoascus sp. 23342-1-I1]|nr:hypothetical protein VE03_10748 [Pseudogymnoascus sp. 23342-1-I1]
MENNLATAYAQPVDRKDWSSCPYAFTAVPSMLTATAVDRVKDVSIKRERAHMKHKAAYSLDRTQSQWSDPKRVHLCRSFGGRRIIRRGMYTMSEDEIGLQWRATLQ